MHILFLISVRLSGGNGHMALFPQVLLALMPSHGLISSRGESVVVIFKRVWTCLFIESALESSILS